MMAMKLALGMSCLWLCGCAGYAWIRANTTEEEMRRDLAQCERDRTAVAGESFFVERCMFSKGYSEE
jgi:hypothetical protein